MRLSASLVAGALLLCLAAALPARTTGGQVPREAVKTSTVLAPTTLTAPAPQETERAGSAEAEQPQGPLPWDLDVATDPFWQTAKAEVLRVTMPIYQRYHKELGDGLDRFVIERGSHRLHKIALTFDDGPHPDTTPELLAILRHYHVKATFFVVGAMARRYPTMLKAIAADGHEIANHTYRHTNLTRKGISPEEICCEIKACGEAVRQITGQSPQYFRPPGGNYNRTTLKLIRACGYTMVLWTYNTADYTEPGEDRILRRMAYHAVNGGIYLMHDGYRQTLACLPRIIEELQARGFGFGTVSEVAEREDRAPH
jgi:peptidoglycan/xylan/chitin deacetylase (PgdA/CDA1 family)